MSIIELYLEEANKIGNQSTITKIVLNKLQNAGYNRTNQTQAKINFKTNDSKEINQIIKNIGVPAKITQEIAPGGLGALSDSFITFEFTLTDDFSEDGVIFNKGLTFKIANAVKNAKIGNSITRLARKELTPAKLNLTDIEWDDNESLMKTTIKQIKNLNTFDEIKNVCIALIKELDQITVKPRINGIMNIENNDTTIIAMTKNTQKLVNSIDIKDLSTIGTDFGEVLGGFYFFKKYDAKRVKFPAESNYKLIDFIVDDVVFVSSKYQQGATPSMSVIADKIKENKSAFKKIDARLLNIINSVGDPQASAMYSYLVAAKEAGSKIYEKLNSLGLIDMNSKQKNTTPNKILEFLQNQMNKFKSEKYEEKIDKLIEFLKKEFWSHANSYPDINKARQLIANNDKNMVGLIIYPMQAETIRLLNNDKAIIDGLSSIAKTLGVKQLYLDFKISTKSPLIIFKIKNFQEQQFKFALNTSANNYLNSKLAFSMQ